MQATEEAQKLEGKPYRKLHRPKVSTSDNHHSCYDNHNCCYDNYNDAETDYNHNYDQTDHYDKTYHHNYYDNWTVEED